MNFIIRTFPEKFVKYNPEIRQIVKNQIIFDSVKNPEKYRRIVFYTAIKYSTCITLVFGSVLYHITEILI